ncbi:MAG: RNB domain-containing ribonuclease [Polyangiaceae bacterium]
MTHAFIGELGREGNRLSAVDLLAGGDPRPLAESQPRAARDAKAGAIVAVREDADGLRVARVLAEADSALAEMYRIAAQHGLTTVFPSQVEAEAAELVAHPGIDDPSLEDLTHLPFVTIDGPGTRDLDQAAYLELREGGYIIYYALADPAHAVRPGTALFAEALRRGATYYLPGLAVPMLPRVLSEDLVSLAPEQDRRAMVFRMEIDSRGHCDHTRIFRARVRSRAQLTFEQVHQFLANPTDNPLPSKAIEESVRLLEPVGRARLEDATARDVVHYRRTETELKLDGKRGMRFVVQLGDRGEVETYNAQLSLLCNIEGALFLERERAADVGPDDLQPIYRVHPSPPPERLDELEHMITALVARRSLDPAVFLWRRAEGQSLAHYLEGLPREGALGHVAKAIHRQAVITNLRSTFSANPGRHYGVGAEVYARFSAPMREIVGIFLHKEVFERLEGKAASADDDALCRQVVERANEAKALQKTLENAANLVALDQLFEADRQRPRDARPWRAGTVMGLTAGKVHVSLESPGVDVKIYTRHLEAQAKAKLSLSPDGTALVSDEPTPRTICCLGDAVEVRVHDRDRSRSRDGRWNLTLRARG